MDIKILYSTEYIERTIFVLEIDGKILNCYRSSGLSGTGHKNKIIPFSSLNELRTFSSPMIGYIYKQYFYDNKWISHRKEFSPIIENFLENISQVVKNVVPPQQFILTEDNYRTDFPLLVKEINNKLKILKKGKDLFDFRVLETN